MCTMKNHIYDHLVLLWRTYRSPWVLPNVILFRFRLLGALKAKILLSHEHRETSKLLLYFTPRKGPSACSNAAEVASISSESFLVVSEDLYRLMVMYKWENRLDKKKKKEGERKKEEEKKKKEKEEEEEEWWWIDEMIILNTLLKNLFFF